MSAIRIPNSLLGVVAFYMSQLCTHQELDGFLDRSEAPSADPGSNKQAKIRNRLEAANRESKEPMRVLGSFLEELLDDGFVNRNQDYVAKAKRDILLQLERFGFRYQGAGVIGSLGDKKGQTLGSVPNSVFVIYGRNSRVVRELTSLLRSVHLRVVQFNEISAQAGASASVFDIVKLGIKQSAAVIALFTPDEMSALHPELRVATDKLDEKYRHQPRPNVFYEAGLAFALNPHSTVLVSVGDVSFPSDLNGIHVVRLGDTAPSRKLLMDKLTSAGVRPDLKSTDYLDTSIAKFELGYVPPAAYDPFSIPALATPRTGEPTDKVARAIEAARAVLLGPLSSDRFDRHQQELAMSVSLLGPAFEIAAERIRKNHYIGFAPDSAEEWEESYRERLKSIIAVAEGVLSAAR